MEGTRKLKKRLCDGKGKFWDKLRGKMVAKSPGWGVGVGGESSNTSELNTLLNFTP